MQIGSSIELELESVSGGRLKIKKQLTAQFGPWRYLVYSDKYILGQLNFIRPKSNLQFPMSNLIGFGFGFV